MHEKGRIVKEYEPHEPGARQQTLQFCAAELRAARG